ncbi:MAG: hypothetical protein JJU37_13190, partial [Balneolaceae bacterium]|nr:hypothetical protein [Balneolaceae bacterium]
MPYIYTSISKHLYFFMNLIRKKNKTILLASANPHKIEELQQMLQPLSIGLKSTLDFPDGEEVVEDLPTLEGNAL